jgi:RNA polymerase sigma-70 factor (ECF subfamily)
MPALLAAARRILGCAHLAEDAVQDALIALWQAWAAPATDRARGAPDPGLASCCRAALSPREGAGEEPRDPHAVRRWLVRAVRHRALHRRRTLLRRARHERDAPRAAPHACDNPLHHAWLAELNERLAVALDALPPPQREAVCLRAEHGLDYHAIARRAKVPVGSVRSRLSRARARLLDLLADMEPPSGERHLVPR